MCYRRLHCADGRFEHGPSVEVPIGDGTVLVYGTTLDACLVRSCNMLQKLSSNPF